MLGDEERLRYARHLALPGFGEDAQERLRGSSALVVGAGGLGSPAALYLAAAGIGRLGIIDDDRVDFSNLQRQPLHGEADIGRPKTASAAARLRALDARARVETFPERLDAANARAIVRGYGVVVDGSDNLPTRYLLNDACAAEGKPLVHAAVEGFEGQLTVFFPPRAPCYRCLYPDPPPDGALPDCAEAGILNTVTGVFGTLQATEAIKLLTGVGEPLFGRLLTWDARDAHWRALQLKRDPACPLCGENPTPAGPPLPAEIRGERLGIPRLTPGEFARTTGALLLELGASPAPAASEANTTRQIPLAELHRRLDELAPWKEGRVVCLCPLGEQGMKAALLLREAGFRDPVVHTVPAAGVSV